MCERNYNFVELGPPEDGEVVRRRRHPRDEGVHDEPLQLIMDNGGKRALIPIENKRQFLEVDVEVMEQVDPIFYSDPVVAARKGLGLA